jgi:hypothetical protein
MVPQLGSQGLEAQWYAIIFSLPSFTISIHAFQSPTSTKSTKSALERSRFNAVDQGILLCSPITTDLPTELQEIAEMAAGNAATLTFTGKAFWS